MGSKNRDKEPVLGREIFLTLIALWVLSFFTSDRSQMQAACLTCGLGLMMCLFKIRSRTQGTTSFTFISIGKKKGGGEEL